MTMRTEVVSSKLILSRFVELSLQMLHLLNRTYNPFYKWQYASARTLPWGEEIVFLLDDLINDSLIYERKLSIIQQICDLFIAKMKELGLTNKNDSYIAHHSDEVLTRMLEKEQLVE